MTWIAQTLWDLLVTAPRDSTVRCAAVRQRPRRARAIEVKAPVRGAGSMQAKYDAIVEEMKQVYGIRVRKWRNSSSGVAWTIRYIQSGKIVRLIESPYPRGPMSCAISSIRKCAAREGIMNIRRMFAAMPLLLRRMKPSSS